MSADEYVPSEAEMVSGLVQLPGEPAGTYRHVRVDEMKRGLARVRRDAAREALDELANAYADDPDINEPEYECEAFVVLAARHYRDAHYPEEAP